MKKLLGKSKFLQYVMVLVSGTMLGQIISFLAAPVITRLYLPEETAMLGLFLRIVAIGSAVATLKYELSLPIVKTHFHAFRLYIYSLRNAMIVSVLSVLLLIIPAAEGSGSGGLILYGMVPVGIFLLAFFNLGTNWAIRKKKFRTISTARVSSSGVTAGMKILLGLGQFGYIGLILATILGMLFSNVWFLRNFLKSQNIFSVKLKAKRNRVLARQYKEFPRINLPHSMMDLSRDLLVAVMIMAIFSDEVFGLYDHAYRMLRLPLIVVGAAVGQVFFQRCSEIYNQGKSTLPLLRKTLISLFFISIIPFTALFFWGEEIFGFVFSQRWSEAGRYSEIMAPWLMMNFLMSSVSSLPLVIRRQKEVFYLAIAGNITLILSLLLPPYLWDASIKETLWIVTAGQTVYLIIFIFILFSFSSKAHGKKSI